MTVWFTSDLHLGHRLVAHLRGYGPSREEADIVAHDVQIMDNWRRVVKADDLVWLLGDVAVSSPVYALDMLSRLPGRKRLILGNHDEPHPMHSRAAKAYQRYAKVFEYISPFARIKVQGHPVLLSHFPYSSDTEGLTEARFTQYRLRDEGMWLLHGHTHGKEKVHGHEIHVGLDAWNLMPVSDLIIASLLESDMSTTSRLRKDTLINHAHDQRVVEGTVGQI